MTHPDRDSNSFDVAIIGAGSSGLAIAWELKQQGISACLIEQADRVAANWRTRHEQLRLNTNRWYSHQPGMRIPARYGLLPTRNDYIAYLEAYARVLGAPIRFGTAVRRLDPMKDQRWWIHTDDETLTTRHVIVATGSERVPVIPEWPGRAEFRGELIHAANFRHSDDYIARRVLLVGVANSAVDIGNYLARVVTGEVWVSARSGASIVPLRLFGVPGHTFLVMMEELGLPRAFQDAVVTMLSRILFGDLSRFGLPPPTKGPVAQHRDDGVSVAADNGFVAAVKSGRFKVVPTIESLTHDSVRLTDGRILTPDAIICATGYRPGLEELVGHLDVLDARGAPRRHADQAQDGLPGLWFFGCNASIYGGMNSRRREAKRLARRITGLLGR